MADKQNLLLFFEHPTELTFMDKGTSPNVKVFDMPDNFLTDRYKDISEEVQTRYSGQAEQRIPVRNISIPDLRLPMSLGRDEQFSLFIPRHREMAKRLSDIFLALPSIDDLQSVVAYARDRINPFLFNYAFSVALLHRPDTKDLDIPSFAQIFPEKFVDSKFFRTAREEASVVPQGSRNPIVIPRDYTGTDVDPEHKLWYFREDMGVNLHHWHWHLVYPLDLDRSVVDKDRRGELFYYMHQQLVARYNMERFSNNLPRTVPFNNFRENIPEAYFPKMDSIVASRSYPPRFANVILHDVNRPADQVVRSLNDMERWRDRIIEAIHKKFVVDTNNKKISLDNEKGIDILGNVVESSILSPDRSFYGDLHNFGHLMAGYVHDPDHQYLESFGVIGDPTTAMRDPFFYKWHAFIDGIFNEHKMLLTPYSVGELNYDGIMITGIQVASDGGQPNILRTKWQQSDLNLSSGMDFVQRGNVFARFTHLQNNPFTYTIRVNNTSKAKRLGMVRIFLGPKSTEDGQPISFAEQRRMMIELDKFRVDLNPGVNNINRRSSESSVTIPFERTYRSLQVNRPQSGTPEEDEFNICGCGWPSYMLIPKGLPEGLTCELFIMISNYENDRIDQQLVGVCSTAPAYCGVRDRLYPDRRPMGFPFDRLPRSGVATLRNFLTPNMSIVDVQIRHENRL